MKTISDIGEFGYIADIRKELKYRSKNVLVGSGDDCAVLNYGEKLLLFTTDSTVEDVHFTKEWFTPLQVGKKAVEINVSDIASMGGEPKFMLASVLFPKNTELKYAKSLYRGLKGTCDKYAIELIGGNMSGGDKIGLNITLIGEVQRSDLCLRSTAKPGDDIYVSGNLGRASSGMDALILDTKKQCSLKHAFQEPKARLDFSRKYAKHINSMIDLSDGLASDLGHICAESKAGALIYEDRIPINASVKKLAEISKKNALDYALYGGEDFELLFTASPAKAKNIDAIKIGTIRKEKSIYLESNSGKTALKPASFDHFK
jgi:thiamine-monophosphate kinase